MRFFILFLLLMPMVQGLAVSPTSLDFSEENVVMIVNTLDEEVEIKMSGVYRDSFVLGHEESRFVEVMIENDVDYLTIEENYRTNLANRISIPVIFYYPEEEPKKDNKVIPIGVGILVGVGVLGIGTFGIVKNRRKRFK